MKSLLSRSLLQSGVVGCATLLVSTWLSMTASCSPLENWKLEASDGLVGNALGTSPALVLEARAEATGLLQEYGTFSLELRISSPTDPLVSSAPLRLRIVPPSPAPPTEFMLDPFDLENIEYGELIVHYECPPGCDPTVWIELESDEEREFGIDATLTLHGDRHSEPAPGNLYLELLEQP